MVEYKCQDCGEQIGFLSADELQRKIDAAEIVKGRAHTVKNFDGGTHTWSEEGYFGICSRCRRLHATQPLQGPDPEFARHKRIMARLAHIRRNNPEMPLEEAAMRATEDEFEPVNEPPSAFRAYLMERYETNKTERSLWAGLVEVLKRHVFGPHAGGAA